MKEAGDFDALWLGGTTLKSKDFSPRLKRLYKGTGGFGVIFRNTMFRELLLRLNQEDYVADVVYMQLQSKYLCYRTVKNLVKHKAGISLIQKKYVDYPNLR